MTGSCGSLSISVSLVLEAAALPQAVSQALASSKSFHQPSWLNPGQGEPDMRTNRCNTSHWSQALFFLAFLYKYLQHVIKPAEGR